jgi:hypothetical protein
MKTVLAGLAALVLVGGARAQGSDELWEVSTQMNMAGMPPGMGGSTQRVCRDKDPRKEAASRPDMADCKVADSKQSGNRFTMTMTCPQGTMVIDHTYNAARTEYKGTMRMSSRDGEMTMSTSGRKIGSCDAKQARAEMAASAAAMQQQAAAAQAQVAAAVKQADDSQIAQCRAALDTMEMHRLGVFAQCQGNPQVCSTVASSQPRAAKECREIQSEFCKRYQTPDGFYKAKGDRQAAEMCAVSAESLPASLCPRAARDEHLLFLARYCPVEAKPYAQQHCAGRQFTSAPRDKYTEFCQTYLANRDLNEPRGQAAAQRPAPSQAEPAKQSVTDGVQQGINKLKGLFGR